jgi:hypothetical protein
MIGIIIQISFIPSHLINMNVHNNNMIFEQNVFRSTFEEINYSVPKNSTLYYFSDDIRKKYGVTQFDEITFQKFLCMQGRCDLRVINNTNADYTILLSKSDFIIYYKLFNETNMSNVIKNR